jgi:hypothetical protein
MDEGLLKFLGFAVFIVITIIANANARKKARAQKTHSRQSQPVPQRQPVQPQRQPRPAAAKAPPLDLKQTLETLFDEISIQKPQTPAEPAGQPQPSPQPRRSTRISGYETAANKTSEKKTEIEYRTHALKSPLIAGEELRKPAGPALMLAAEGVSSAPLSPFHAQPSPKKLQEMIVWSEILGTPVGLRE